MAKQILSARDALKLTMNYSFFNKTIEEINKSIEAAAVRGEHDVTIGYQGEVVEGLCHFSNEIINELKSLGYEVDFNINNHCEEINLCGHSTFHYFRDKTASIHISWRHPKCV